ncbi:MAG: O-antigen ligase family protein [Planctomycetota bacterium]
MLVKFCSRIIEAAWLVAIAGIPVFFNPYTTRVFESDKTYLLRSIAIVMLLAWLIKKSAEGFLLDTAHKEKGNRLILFTVLALITVYFVASVFSIVPYFSFKGYFLRQEGFYSFASYILIFFIILGNLREKAQVYRLIHTMILSATIVSVYGIMQHFKIDTVAWAGGERVRVTTTFGGPIFAGAYLIIVIPLIISRLMEHISAGLRKNIPITILYAVILAINIYCMFLTQSRGPLIGMLVSLSLYFILFTRLRQMKRLFLTVVVVIIACISFLVVLNIPNGPLSGLQNRLGRISQLIEDDTIKVRLLTWEAAIDVFKSSPERLVFGYGLESLFPLYHKHIPSSFWHYEGSAIPDHSHNETFDILITSGILGLAAYLGIIFLLLYYTFNRLGFFTTPYSRKLFALSLCGGAILGLVIPLALGKMIFIGLTIPFGFMAGLFSYLLLTWKTETQLSETNLFLLIGLISAIIAHFTEIQFFAGITTTRLYFWTCVAIILAVINTLPQFKPTPTAVPVNEKKNAIPLALVYGCLSGLIIAFFSFALLKRKFVTEGIPQEFYIIILTIVALSTLYLVFVAIRSSRVVETIIYLLTMIILWAIFHFVLYALLKSPDILPGDFIKVILKIIDFFYIFVIITILVISCFLTQKYATSGFISISAGLSPVYNNSLPPLLRGNSGQNPPYQRGNKGVVTPYETACTPTRKGVFWTVLVAFALTILTILSYVAIKSTNLNETYADAWCREGENHEKGQRWTDAVACFQRSIELSPRTDYFYADMARAYKSNGDYGKSIEALHNALKANPLNPFHQLEIARAYRDWSDKIKDNPKEQEAKLAQSIKAYQTLILMTPKNPAPLREIGNIFYTKKEYDKSTEYYLKAVALDNRLTEVYYIVGKTYKQSGNIAKSIELYEKAFNAGNNQIGLTLGEEYFNQNRFEDCLKVNLRLIQLEPWEYRHHHNAAVTLDQLGRLDEAIEYSKKALELIRKSMPTQTKGIEGFLNKLEEKKKSK